MKGSASVVALLVLLTAPALAQDDPKQIAARYAPVIYQEFSIYTQDKKNPDRAYDQLRRVDYDGDWNTLNNLDHSGDAGTDDRGYVYYDVKSTATHHYVTYTFYYVARTGTFMRRSENDLMGCVVVARRDAPKGQEVEVLMLRERKGMTVVRQEGDLSPERRRYEGRDGRRRKIDQAVERMQFDHPEIDPEQTHPRIFMDAWHHGPQVLDPERQRRGQLPFPFMTGRGLVYHYHPSVAHQAPEPGETVVRYELLPASELDKVQTLDDGGQRLGADDKGWRARGPLLPHAWPVGKGIAPGAMATDPAGTIAELFDVRQPFGTAYEADAAAPVARGQGAAGRMEQPE